MVARSILLRFYRAQIANNYSYNIRNVTSKKICRKNEELPLKSIHLNVLTEPGCHMLSISVPEAIPSTLFSQIHLCLSVDSEDFKDAFSIAFSNRLYWSNGVALKLLRKPINLTAHDTPSLVPFQLSYFLNSVIVHSGLLAPSRLSSMCQNKA